MTDVAEAAQLARSSLFIGARVQLDEHRWSPSFAAQLSTWASTAPTLVVMDGGKAMVSDRRSPVPFADQVREGWNYAHHVAASAGGPRQIGLCAVFRFESGAITPALSSAVDLTALAPSTAPRAGGPLVQLCPGALFRYYWRRHALVLGYPSPEVHVEEDAMALLRHVLSRTWPPGRILSADESRRRVRHRTLARAAQAFMSLAIADPHPVAQIAHRLDTSPFHLAHVFQTEVGVSLHQYLVQLRLAAALVRLRAGAPDLSTLALELGFCHHSHFSVAFRRAIGRSPREVRRMLTAGSSADFEIATRRCS